jgi:iron complex outermembrane receptor protein
MSFTRSVGLRTAVSAILSLSAIHAAHSQEAASETVMVLEEILITAEKREAKLQDVPIAVSAFTDELRDVVGIRGIEDLAAFTPGLNYSSLDRLSIRGIGRYTNALGSDPGVATYNDGVYTNSTTDSNKSQLFIERVEMLRGPQGTLYGRNSMGGAINVISRRPTHDELEGEVRLIGGSYKAWDVGATLSAPITDSFRFRLTAQSANRDEGYFKNNAGEDRYRKETFLAEVQLEADFGDAVNWWLKYSKADWGANNSEGSLNNVLIDPYYSGVSTPLTGALVPNGQSIASANGLTNPGVLDHYAISENTTASGQRDNADNVVMHITFDLGGSSLKYLGGWQQSDFTLTNDYDGTSFEGSVTSVGPLNFVTPVFPQYYSLFGDYKRTYSNELDWTSNFSEVHKFIFGLYQYHEETDNPVSLHAPGNADLINSPFVRATPTGIAPSATLATPSVDGRFYYAHGELETDSYAAFLQYDLQFADQWGLTLGARYTQDEKSGDETLRLITFFPTAGGTGAAATDTSPATNTRHLEDKWGAASGKVGINWTPSDTTLLYANYNRGYKSGGFNLGTLIPVPTVEEETLDAVELGWKTNVTQTLQLNGSVFYYMYDNMQVPFAQFRNGINTTIFTNTDATTYGAELETAWAASDNLSFLLNYSYLKAEVDRACRYESPTNYSDCYYDSTDPQALALGAQPVGLDNATVPNRLQNLQGNQLPQAPENKVAFHTNYALDFAAGSLTLSGSYVWQDETSYSLFNNPAFRTEDFGTANARILWDDAKERYTVIGFVNNALDDEGYNGVAVTAASLGARRSYNLTAPRVYGMEVQVRF